MKYIIEAPDETEWIQFIGQTGMGTPNLKMIKASDAVPYEEPNREAIEQEIRKQVEDEVWSLARKIILAPVHGGLDVDEMIDCFGSRYYSKTMQGTYAEAKAKYDKWLADKDKIKV